MNPFSVLLPRGTPTVRVLHYARSALPPSNTPPPSTPLAFSPPPRVSCVLLLPGAARALGYFNSGNALTHGSALAAGADMVQHLGMSDIDRVCVSITLYHAFGIGSACSAALLSGAAIVLPAVGGLQVKNRRAAVT